MSAGQNSGYSLAATQYAATTERSEEIAQRRPDSLTTVDQPGESIRYVEVPYVVEELKYVPVKRVIEIEKKMPVYIEEIVERIVEVPEVQIVERVEEVEQIEEVLVEVPRREVVIIEKEVIREVRVPQKRIVEKIVEVPGEIIEQEVEKEIVTTTIKPVFNDSETKLVGSHIVQPIFTEDAKRVQTVPAAIYEPEIEVFNILVPKIVEVEHCQGVLLERKLTDMQLSRATYNLLLLRLNQDLTDMQSEHLPFEREASGSICVRVGAEADGEVNRLVAAANAYARDPEAAVDPMRLLAVGEKVEITPAEFRLDLTELVESQKATLA